MEILAPKYRRNPNELVHSLYQGVSSLVGGQANVIVKKHPTEDRMQRTITPASGGLQRGQGGMAAVLVLGGMETTLAEMEYILEARQSKKFVPKRTSGDVAEMCRLVADRRNEEFMAARKLPQVASTPKPRRRGLYLPRGFRMVPTSEPGLKIRVRA